MPEPIRIYGVSDVAKEWGITPERVRQLLRVRLLLPDLVCLRRKDYIESYWYAIPERHNGLVDLIVQFQQEDDG